MKNTNYLVIQKGYGVFGSGATPQEALENAKEWMDRDEDINVDDLKNYNSANDGEFCIATQEQYNQNNQ